MYQRMVLKRKILMSFQRVSLNAMMQRPSFLRSSSLNLSYTSKVSDEKDSKLCDPMGNYSNLISIFCDPMGNYSKLKAMEKLQEMKEKRSSGLLFISEIYRLGFKHDVETFTEIVGLLCDRGMDSRLNDLFMEVITGGGVSFQIPHLFEAFREKKMTKAFDMLIKACANDGKFNEAVSEIIRGGAVVSTGTCNFVMDKLVEYGDMRMLEFAYTELKKNGFFPNVYTHWILTKGRCKDGRPFDVITQMREDGIEPNAFIYGNYIQGLCSEGKPDLAFQQLKKNMWEVDVSAYTCIIRSFLQESKLKRAEDVLHYMTHREVVPNADCYHVLLGGYCEERDIDNAEDLTLEMRSRGIKIDSVIVNRMMQRFCDLRMSEKAFYVFRYLMLPMQSCFCLDRESFRIAIYAACKVDELAYALWLVEEMKARKIGVDDVHYETLIDCARLHLDIWTLRQIFDMMIEDVKMLASANLSSKKKANLSSAL